MISLKQGKKCPHNLRTEISFSGLNFSSRILLRQLSCLWIYISSELHIATTSDDAAPRALSDDLRLSWRRPNPSLFQIRHFPMLTESIIQTISKQTYCEKSAPLLAIESHNFQFNLSLLHSQSHSFGLHMINRKPFSGDRCLGAFWNFSLCMKPNSRS